MPHTGLACPACDRGGNLNALMTSPGVYGYKCSQGHIYNDMESLLSMNPKKIAVPTSAKKPREGLVEFKMALPSKLVEGLRDKFGDKLSGAMEVILAAVLDSGSFIVTGFDVDRLQQHLGQKVKDSGTLIGLIVSLKMSLDEAKKELEANKAEPAASVVPVNDIQGDFVQVALRVPLDEFMEIKDRAKFNNAAPAAYIQQIISHGLTNKWF